MGSRTQKQVPAREPPEAAARVAGDVPLGLTRGPLSLSSPLRTQALRRHQGQPVLLPSALCFSSAWQAPGDAPRQRGAGRLCDSSQCFRLGLHPFIFLHFCTPRHGVQAWSCCHHVCDGAVRLAGFSLGAVGPRLLPSRPDSRAPWRCSLGPRAPGRAREAGFSHRPSLSAQHHARLRAAGQRRPSARFFPAVSLWSPLAGLLCLLARPRGQ